MGESMLVGMVSDEAAELYERLRATSGSPVADRSAFVESSVATELIEAGVLYFRDTATGRSVCPVPPALAVCRLLDRRHREISALQASLAATWERFAATVSPASGALESGELCVVTDHAEVAHLTDELYRSPRRLLRAAFTAGTIDRTLVPPGDTGAEFRVVYDVTHATDVRIQQARIRKAVPVNMVHVDDTVALITIDQPDEAAALYVRSPAVVELLADWFDMMWLAPDTTAAGGGLTCNELTAARHKVLKLMACGLTDEAIARQTGTAVRTVRRHISAILETLQVSSRFSAGVAAAKRGWL